METYQDKILDSPSKDSYIGSYYDPPNRITLTLNEKEAPVSPSITMMSQQRPSPRVSQTSTDLDSKAVIEALKTLQEKIRRLELERKQAEMNANTFSLAARNYEHGGASTTTQKEAPSPETDNSGKKELDSQLQSAEARCQVLEKQLDYMKKMVEKAEKDKNALAEKQASLQRQRLLTSSDIQTQSEKLENLEKQCLRLNETQASAERKIAVLEERLLKEEHERKLLQGKADELQKELNVNLNLQLCPDDTELTPKKKKPTAASRTPSSIRKQGPPPSPSYTKGNRMPFVAGTSTSPSHSVHANLQSILHMMKHHQPQLCEQVQSMRRSGFGAKKSLRKALSASTSAPHEPAPGTEQAAQSLSCLSDLLLALQDELGQMSFEHQELVSQIDVTDQRVHREDLERELEALVKKMEEKSAQITKLRKHQQTVQKLTQKTQDGTKKASDIRAPLLSPVRAKRQEKRGRATPSNLQLLRETQQFNSRLKQYDLSWET